MRLLDQEIKLRENLGCSLNRYPLWWIILIITIFFDFLSTSVFVAQYGPQAEANFTTRLMMENINPRIGNFIGKALQLVAVICLVSLSRRVGNFFMLFVIVLNCWAIVMNSIG